LIRVGREILPLGSFDSFDNVIDEVCKVDNAVIDIGRFVDTNQWLVEDLEEIAE
jgi:hypothetical protein